MKNFVAGIIIFLPLVGLLIIGLLAFLLCAPFYWAMQTLEGPRSYDDYYF